MSFAKQERRLLRLGEQLGYNAVAVTKRGHLKLRHSQTGEVVIVARKEGGRTPRNAEAELRRHARTPVQITGA